MLPQGNKPTAGDMLPVMQAKDVSRIQIQGQDIRVLLPGNRQSQSVEPRSTRGYLIFPGDCPVASLWIQSIYCAWIPSRDDIDDPSRFVYGVWKSLSYFRMDVAIWQRFFNDSSLLMSICSFVFFLGTRDIPRERRNERKQS